MPRNPCVNIDDKQIICKTYKEFKRTVKDLIKESRHNEVVIFRERRGEWGEWFEKWSLVAGNPKITEQGWM